MTEATSDGPGIGFGPELIGWLQLVDRTQLVVLSGAMSVIGFVAAGATAALPAFVAFGCTLALVSLVDLAEKRIPNVILMAAAAVSVPLLVLAGTAGIDGTSLERAVIGAVATFVGYLGLAVLSPSGIGMGDVKLSPLIGAHLAFWSWGALMWGVVTGFLLFSLLGLVLISRGIINRQDKLPFGPFMAAGAMLMLLVV